MRWPLRYQILVPFAGVMLGSVLVVSLLNAWLAAKRTQRQIESQLHDVARTLVDSSFPLTDSVLKQTKGLSGAEFVLVSKDGEVQASSMELATAPPARAPATQSFGARDAFHLGPTVTIGAEQYFQAAISTRPRDGRLPPSVLHILYPERIWREATWQAAYPALVVGGAALALVSLLAVAIAARLSRPITQLRSQVNLLAQGDFQPVELPAHDDELRDLAVSVNSLALQLDELKQVIKRSERLALLGQLSGGLAHHLRNDVTGARMAVQLHQRHCRDVDQESLTVALRQLSLTEEHLQKFLAAGQPKQPARIPCNLRELVEAMVELIEPACRHRKVDLQIVGELNPEVELHADPEQLRQLLLNLVLNAVDAAGPGGWVRIELAICQDASASSRQFRLRVIDSGLGPPRELESALFEPFTTSKPEGIGLGLAVARQIAAAHSGSLSFHRLPQTCFELTLPSGNGQPRGEA